MKKKTKVMPSSPSNPKHKLRKQNVKKKKKKMLRVREEKKLNKRREILLIEQLKRVDPK